MVPERDGIKEQWRRKIRGGRGREVGWERAGDGVEEEEYLEEDDDYEEVYSPHKLSIHP